MPKKRIVPTLPAPEELAVSATECTGMMPRPVDEEGAESLTELTSMPCAPSITERQDPTYAPLLDAGARPCDARNPRSTRRGGHPAR